MLSKLEERLELYAAKKPITSDRELEVAIGEIMDEQFALPPEKRNPALVREGTEALMTLRGVDPRRLNSRASAIINRRTASGTGDRASGRVRRVLPVAAVVAVVLILAVVGVALARGGGDRGNTRETATEAPAEVTPSVLPAKKDNVVRSYATFAEAVESEDLPALMTCADFNDPGMVEEVTYIDYGDREQLLVKMRDDPFDVLTVTIPSQGYVGDGNPVMIGDRDAMMTVDENGCRIEWIDGGNLYSVRADTEERATAVAAELTETD